MPSCLPRETGQPRTGRGDRQPGRRGAQLTHGLTLNLSPELPSVIKPDTLVIGIDLAKHTHVARA
ncbi:MAG: hypothetical protein Q8N70_09605, partial [Deltaproteobacteria bacterium]|nr:hypothetical protein [Deltaproteobacteria bacterium]